MNIKYLGHSSFLITSDTGMKIITDPYETGGGLNYGEIKESADIVTVSHDHSDHNNAAAVQDNPQVVRGAAKVKGMEFKGISTYHDEAQGGQRGKNTILCFGVDGIKVCHLGFLWVAIILLMPGLPLRFVTSSSLRWLSPCTIRLVSVIFLSLVWSSSFRAKRK